MAIIVTVTAQVLDADVVKPVAPPYYESRFVRANDPHGPRAVWLRETLLLPSAGDSVADVWVMMFDPDGVGNRAIKVAHPLDASDYDYDTWTARIGEARIDDVSASGAVTADGRSAAWDLRIEPGDAPPVKLLTERGYRAKFPTAKTMVRHPLARFDGHVTLEDGPLDTAHFDVDGWPGSVNHNWGKRHTPAYAFGQVCGFDEAPGASLEIVTAHAAVGPLKLPGATLFVLRHARGEIAVRSILAARRTYGQYEPFTWSFGGRSGRATIEGEITADPADVIGLTYVDTTGHLKYCYNSALATCRIILRDSAFGNVELNVSRRAMLEILLPEPHPIVPLLA
jgi:hypothetical protein